MDLIIAFAVFLAICVGMIVATIIVDKKFKYKPNKETSGDSNESDNNNKSDKVRYI